MSHESLWDFSLRVYHRPQVREACLRLQDEHGFDVNLLLLACWFGRRRGVLPAPLLADVLAFAAPWSVNVVHPLRHARRWLKDALAGALAAPLQQQPGTELRERIKTVELRSEQIQQQVLEALCARWLGAQTGVAPDISDSLATRLAAEKNLHAIAVASAVTLTPAVQQLFDILQQAAGSD
jgi:uncharacterized protein (TIGR02444 family)